MEKVLKEIHNKVKNGSKKQWLKEFKFLGLDEEHLKNTIMAYQNDRLLDIEDGNPNEIYFELTGYGIEQLHNKFGTEEDNKKMDELLKIAFETYKSTISGIGTIMPTTGLEYYYTGLLEYQGYLEEINPSYKITSEGIEYLKNKGLAE
uniref:Uncharacterized protein n=1 Tax=Methanococcus maripaludis (strain C6 / ATCC BAA-1332) TaxID=444158 RepID=A9A7F1_METM6